MKSERSIRMVILTFLLLNYSFALYTSFFRMHALSVCCPSIHASLERLHTNAKDKQAAINGILEASIKINQPSVESVLFRYIAVNSDPSQNAPILKTDTWMQWFKRVSYLGTALKSITIALMYTHLGLWLFYTLSRKDEYSIEPMIAFECLAAYAMALMLLPLILMPLVGWFYAAFHPLETVGRNAFIRVTYTVLWAVSGVLAWCVGLLIMFYDMIVSSVVVVVTIPFECLHGWVMGLLGRS